MSQHLHVRKDMYVMYCDFQVLRMVMKKWIICNGVTHGSLKFIILWIYFMKAVIATVGFME